MPLPTCTHTGNLCLLPCSDLLGGSQLFFPHHRRSHPPDNSQISLIKIETPFQPLFYCKYMNHRLLLNIKYPFWTNSGLLGNHDRPTDKPNDRPTDSQANREVTLRNNNDDNINKIILIMIVIIIIIIVKKIMIIILVTGLLARSLQLCWSPTNH